MTWSTKERDWERLVSDIQEEIDANRDVIPNDRLADIQGYLDHGEYSMAFEYLYLEIMERDNAKFTLGAQKAREIGFFFELNDENECMVDAKFWPRFEEFLSNRSPDGGAAS